MAALCRGVLPTSFWASRSALRLIREIMQSMAPWLDFSWLEEQTKRGVLPWSSLALIRLVSVLTVTSSSSFNTPRLRLLAGRWRAVMFFPVTKETSAPYLRRTLVVLRYQASDTMCRGVSLAVSSISELAQPLLASSSNSAMM